MTATRNFVDLSGEVYGRLTVERRAGINNHGAVEWSCRCDCGAATIASTASLKGGYKKSCGCLRKENIAQVARSRALTPQEKRESILRNRAAQRLKRKTDPLKSMQARLSRLHRHALAQVGAIKTSPTFEQLGYTAEQFVAHIERQFVRGMGWHNMKLWQIDHIIPISEAKTEDDVVALNQLPNLRPMWACDNNAKKNRRVNLL